MGLERNFCLDGGWLVSSRHPLPPWPFAYKWSRQTNANGCNNLVCQSCGAKVVWRVGCDAPTEAPAAVYKLWASDAPADAATATWARTYVCKCHLEHQQGANPAPVTDENWGTTTPWKCGGHPVLVTPTSVLGVTLGMGDWDDVVAALALLQAAAVQADPFSAPPVLATVMAALRGDDQQQFGQALLSAVRHPDLVVRAESVRAFVLFDVWPQWPRALAELVLAEPRWTQGVAEPGFPDQTLDWWAARAIAAIAPPQSTVQADRDHAIAMMRRAVVAAGGAGMLTYALACLDPEWCAVHIVELGRVDSDAPASVLLALQSRPDLQAQAQALVQAATVH